MNNINFLKPDKSNLNTFLYTGSFLFFISVLDVFLNSFFKFNFVSFLPNEKFQARTVVACFIGLVGILILFYDEN